MKAGFLLVAGALALATATAAEGASMNLPRTVVAGDAFSVQTAGSGNGVLYIVGPGQALARDVQLGQTVSFAAGELYNAGHYLAVLVEGSSPAADGALDVVPANQPANLSFLAKPSRLPVGLRNGISGSVYVLDTYHNLITAPLPVSFSLSNPSGAVQKRTVNTQNGVAWTEMDSGAKEGAGKFTAQAGGASSTRVVEQVPGDPCNLRMSAQQSGKWLQLQTAPVLDCNGNAVPDGTIVSFTERYGGMQSTVDVPLKRGIARVEMPARPGATISVASGVVAGNEIRWEGGR